jgi:hypothetical protein
MLDQNNDQVPVTFRSNNPPPPEECRNDLPSQARGYRGYDKYDARRYEEMSDFRHPSTVRHSLLGKEKWDHGCDNI